ncbi:MAG: phosphoribosylamine--glycine ligase [Bacteroidota bacterium]
MNILILGGGGREHALAWKIAQSPLCKQLYIAPGNAGTGQIGTNVKLDSSDLLSVLELVQEKQIGLVVIGPEQPLVDGVADALTDVGVPVVGPKRAAAHLEGSKEFAKAFMRDNDIPTAAYAAFQSHQLAEAQAYIDEQALPVVVKASGLAAGKGVLICETHEEAKQAAAEMLSGSAFGTAGKTIVVEQFLKGIEISVFVLTDGKDYMILPSAKDYKRIGEGDTGLNTGGMGAVSPVPFADEAFMEQVDREIVKPTMAGLQKANLDYRGFIFIGLMVDAGVPYVLEYNVRLGDPETEVILPRIQSDFVALMKATAEGTLKAQNLQVDSRTCTTVMLVSGGYPKAYEKGKAISGLDAVEDAVVFQAGTKQDGDQIVTNGGRVLAVSAFGEDIASAVQTSLHYANEIDFEGKYYRTDIGRDLMG